MTDSQPDEPTAKDPARHTGCSSYLASTQTFPGAGGWVHHEGYPTTTVTIKDAGGVFVPERQR